MNRKFVMQAGYLMLFLLVLFAVLSFLGLIHFGSRWKEIARQTQVKADIANYAHALSVYSNTFGALPAGGNADVTAALTGSNRQRLIFLDVQRLSKRGEFVDPYARPYEIEVTTNQIRIIRPSP